MDRRQREGMLFIIGAVMGYSFLPVFTHYLLGSGLEPPDIAIWRYTFAAPLFWLFALSQSRGVREVRPLPRLRLLLLGPLLAAAALTAFFGLEIMPAGTYVVIFYTYPAIIALLSIPLGDRLPTQGWVALGLTLIGVILTTPEFIGGLVGDSPFWRSLGVAPGESTAFAGGDGLLGVSLALINALVVAVYFILNNRTLKDHPDKARGSAYIVTGTMITLWLVGLVSGINVPQGSAWLYMIGLAIVSTVFPVFCLSNGIAKLGAPKASIIGTFEPLLTAFIAMIFIGGADQMMKPIQWIGGGVIVLSVILLQLRRPTRQDRDTPAPLNDGRTTEQFASPPATTRTR